MIFCECNTDQFIIEQSGIRLKQIDHSGCKSRVITSVGKASGKVLGMIDEDPGCSFPKEMKKYSRIKTISDLELLIRQGDQDKKIIQIKPRLEVWVLKRAKSMKIKPIDYGLKDHPDELHGINPYKDSRYRKFLVALIGSGDEEIETLKKWLTAAVS
ncbi:MAG: hypothetical protein L0Y73_05985 [Candidatus Aminicenantes bacterium]|nr:hypothetical protein [Candidatus Aminicenantes bacterium]